METIIARDNRTSLYIKKRRRLIKTAVRGGRKCVHIPLTVRIEPVKKKPFKRFFLTAAKAAVLCFWFFFMGGFLVVSGKLLLEGFKFSLRAGNESFFYVLDYHKYLWYTTAIWKRNL